MDKNPQYFEGILQLRNPTEELLNFVANQIEKNNISVAKQVKHKNGIDLYLSSNKFLRGLGKKLQNSFGGEMKESATLHTRSRLTSKDLYRVTLLFRLPEFKVGDEITYKGEIVRVLSLGKEVFGRSIETGKKIHIKFKDLD